MKYLGYAVGTVLLLSAFMRVGSRSHGSDMANAEAMRSAAEETTLAATSARTVSYGNGYQFDGRRGLREPAIEADIPDDAELDHFPDLADERRPMVPDMPAEADWHRRTDDLPPAPAIFPPRVEDHLQDP